MTILYSESFYFDTVHLVAYFCFCVNNLLIVTSANCLPTVRVLLNKGWLSLKNIHCVIIKLRIFIKTYDMFPANTAYILPCEVRDVLNFFISPQLSQNILFF